MGREHVYELLATVALLAIFVGLMGCILWVVSP